MFVVPFSLPGVNFLAKFKFKNAESLGGIVRKKSNFFRRPFVKQFRCYETHHTAPRLTPLEVGVVFTCQI